ncbi:MAG: recombination factor protein RarA, partial [Gammaproteobacteria bacterium]|nr:recombination factor protein RarA [Gammaproteobacteria bacterium]
LLQLEIAADLAPLQDDVRVITRATLDSVLQTSLRRFDKGGDLFYDQISALHKSIRGSDPDAALYWLCRMLDGGCDPNFIARRLLRVASEDVGNADPRALSLSLDAWEAYRRLGSPEGELALAHAAVYLACVPKSNAVYTAFSGAMQQARDSGSVEVPLHLRNAPTALATRLGHGEGYRYAHDEQDGFAAGERYLPEELGDMRFYAPLPRGLEEKIAARLQQLRERNRGARENECDA